MLDIIETATGNGARIAEATLTQPGALQPHNSGIDFDGKYIWATIAQYGPNSTAHVIKVKPETLEQETVLQYIDHLGGIVHDVQKNEITALNPGASNASAWKLNQGNSGHNQLRRDSFTQPERTVRNPTCFVDYQDCKFLGHSRYCDDRPGICSDVATIRSGLSSYNRRGVAIVDVQTMVPLMEVPITVRSVLGTPVTKNPVEVGVEDGKLILYFLPD